VLLLGPVAATIEVKKTSTVGPLGLLLEIWEHPPSMLKNVNGGPMGGGAGDLRVPTINAKNINSGPP
jgi:hypothetical protein